MITFCLIIFLVVSFCLFINGLLGFFGLVGDGLEGCLEGLWGAITGLGLTLCAVGAIVKLCDIHISFG